MDGQKTTSKTSLLNSTLLKAWRERWTDGQWVINIKAVLPRGVSGDVYNLADCILQQAVVGYGANQLIISYLRHSLCAHLISHAAVLKRISKYDGYDKYHCVNSLLEFLDAIIGGVTCRNKHEETLLTNSVVSLVFWLTKVYATAIDISHGANIHSYDQILVIERAGKVMEKIIKNKFLIGIIYLGKHDDRDLYQLIIKMYNDISKIIAINKFLQLPNYYLMQECLGKIAFLDVEQIEMLEYDINKVEPITYCLQPLLAVEVLLNPSSDTQIYVAELMMIQRLKNYTMPRLYCEIIRACLIALNNVSGTNRESMWCAFTFIKVPHILKQLNLLGKDYDDKLDYSPDVINAFELLLEDTTVLDFMDTKCACNIVECLLNEMMKQNLINDKYLKYFSNKRDAITSNLLKLERNKAQPSIVKFVIRAEPPLAGILKTLSTDYNKVQEPLLSMLCQVLSGNSFELILSVATVEGKLKTFVSRLIKCNECSKQVPGEIGKQAMIRSSLFDVSFLMLSFIVQKYGSDVVLDENGDTFFEKWVRECMVERNKCKSPMNMVHLCDQNKVDELLMYLNATDGSAKNSSLTWSEVCMNIPGMLYHVLMAWENETLSATDVKIILDSMKVRLCAYSVCAASWLCAYMQIVRQDELLKPMNMVQQFLTAVSQDEISQQETFKERLGLTFQVIRKMQHDFHPAGNPKIRALMLTQNLVSPLPLDEQFIEVWRTVTERGWLPIESTQILDSLLQSCGPLWLVTKLVNEILACKYVKDMNRTMDIVFAIMHLDIERCTIALLSELLPMLLRNKMQTLVEPHSTVLARLCVYAILSTLETPNSHVKKRSRTTEQDDIDNICSVPKIRKLNPEHSGDSCSSDFIETIINRDPPMVIREPLQTCLQNLLKTFQQYALMDDLTPKIYFILQFLSLLVQCGKDRIKSVIKLIPNGLVQNLLKIIMTDEIRVGLIVRLYDLNTINGRQSAMSDLCLYRNIQLRQEGIKL